MQRRISKQIQIGNVKIGGDAPISVQSMTNTDTRDVESTLKQIYNLSEQGCELVRLAILNRDAAEAVKEIKKKSPLPLIADIHFDYRLAIRCIENGIDALRINPGNIGKEEHTKKVVELAKINDVPIRIGINGGSLEKEFEQMDIPLAEKMVMSAMRHIKILEDNNFDKIKISLKSSDVLTTIEAYRLIANKVDYPLHLGVTEAGTYTGGIIKSAVGLGTLLAEGIGDTIRVSLTDSPIEEVKAGFLILKSLGLRKRGINFVSCPTCGRTQIDLISLAKEVEKKLENFDKPLTIAVMGCAVNGPGEAKHADYGIAGGIKEGYIFKKGEIIMRLPEEKLVDEFINLIQMENL
ncbi:TPA: flavodoxin-dependent (E)-4-hydroxy-3-methylbut-2-enyl-diphosphate synthase [Candidatus Avigastranaerophilus faecigallinarum]|nr:flavodoxin-dependent (E)-4-hydroxy-3-methylbut-2-enyl-diphosphate synthase [Candidatus Avigastranaerophilus faecigallinarum]